MILTPEMQTAVRWRARLFKLMRVGWLVLVALAYLMFVLGLPPRYVELVTTCESNPAVECLNRQFSAAQANALATIGLTLADRALMILTGSVIIALASLVIAILLFWRRSDDWVALLIALAFVSFNTDVTTVSLAAVQPVWQVPATALASIGSALFPVIFFIFPDGRIVPRWARFLLLAWGLVLCVGLIFNVTNIVPPAQAQEIGNIAWLSMFAASVASQVYRYFRVADRVQRQQTKWIVVGLGLVVLVGIGSIIFEGIAHPLTDEGPSALGFDFFNTVVNIAIGVGIPLTFAIAILRYRLWDIDVFIRRTVTYALVTGLLLLVFFGSVILLQQVFASLTGVSQNELVTVLSTLAIAALFVPLRNRVQNEIDHRFNRKKYDAGKVLEEFAKTVRDETDLERLTMRLMQVVDETMQPTSLSVWLKTTDRRRQIAKKSEMERGLQ